MIPKRPEYYCEHRRPFQANVRTFDLMSLLQSYTNVAELHTTLHVQNQWLMVWYGKMLEFWLQWYLNLNSTRSKFPNMVYTDSYQRHSQNKKMLWNAPLQIYVKKIAVKFRFTLLYWLFAKDFHWADLALKHFCKGGNLLTP